MSNDNKFEPHNNTHTNHEQSTLARAFRTEQFPKAEQIATDEDFFASIASQYVAAYGTIYQAENISIAQEPMPTLDKKINLWRKKSVKPILKLPEAHENVSASDSTFMSSNGFQGRSMVSKLIENITIHKKVYVSAAASILVIVAASLILVPELGRLRTGSTLAYNTKTESQAVTESMDYSFFPDSQAAMAGAGSPYSSEAEDWAADSDDFQFTLPSTPVYGVEEAKSEAWENATDGNMYSRQTAPNMPEAIAPPTSSDFPTFGAGAAPAADSTPSSHTAGEFPDYFALLDNLQPEWELIERGLTIPTQFYEEQHSTETLIYHFTFENTDKTLLYVSASTAGAIAPRSYYIPQMRYDIDGINVRIQHGAGRMSTAAFEYGSVFFMLEIDADVVQLLDIVRALVLNAQE